MITRRALLTGATGALGSALVAPGVAASSRTIPLRIGHASMRYSLDRRQHEHDARAVFRHARETGQALVSGTESGHTNSLHRQIPAAAHAHGYAIRISRWGAWVAVDRRFGTIVDSGEIRAIPGLSLPARLGGHSPRGIIWARIRPDDPSIGTITYGASHWLSRRSRRAQHTTNRRLVRAVSRWARRVGDDHALVFYAADTNEDDARVDVFAGGPLRTCWDEIGEHPRTWRRRCIDVIASYDGDSRVSCRDARVLTDRRLFLFSDHSLIDATYVIRPLV